MYEVADVLWYDEPGDGHIGEVFFKGYSSSEYLDEILLMQYTNLCDRYNTEIFEGDVLEYVDQGASRAGLQGKRRCVVERTEFGAWTPFDDLLHPALSQCTVIGNIYQNPELARGA